MDSAAAAFARFRAGFPALRDLTYLSICDKVILHDAVRALKPGPQAAREIAMVAICPTVGNFRSSLPSALNRPKGLVGLRTTYLLSK